MPWRIRYSRWSPMPSLIAVRIAWASPLLLHGNSTAAATLTEAIPHISSLGHALTLQVKKASKPCKTRIRVVQLQQKAQAEPQLWGSQTLKVGIEDKKVGLVLGSAQKHGSGMHFKNLSIALKLEVTCTHKLSAPGRLDPRSPKQAHYFQQEAAH